MKTAIIIIFLSFFNLSVIAQVKNDSIASNVLEQGYLNFPAIRTLSISYETNLSHEYSLKKDDNEIEKGKLKGLNTLRLSTTLPIIQKKKLSIFVNGKANMFFIDNDVYDSELTSLFDNSSYNFYQLGLSANYRLKMFNRQAMLNATILGDAGNDCFGQIQGIISATVTIRQNPNTHLSLGLSALTLFNRIPAFVTLNYWHKFSDNFNVDISLPYHAFFRYRPLSKHRFSLGMSLLCDGFYIKNPDKYVLQDKVYYNKVMIDSEFVYEFIISKHFLLTAKTGTNIYFMNGIYKSNRKGIDGDPLIKMDSKKSAFFNVGLSYNL